MTICNAKNIKDNWEIFQEVLSYDFLGCTNINTCLNLFSHAPVIDWTDPTGSSKVRPAQKAPRRIRMIFTSSFLTIGLVICKKDGKVSPLTRSTKTGETLQQKCLLNRIYRNTNSCERSSRRGLFPTEIQT